METEQKKILLVDDDQFLIGIYTEQAEAVGIELKTALGGEEAIALLEGGFDASVVALDMSMAGMTGIDMLKIIKEKNLVPNAKLVVLSNTTDDNTVAEAKALGAHSFIVKASILPSEVIAELVKIAQG